jgi:hypothetical protein
MLLAHFASKWCDEHQIYHVWNFKKIKVSSYFLIMAGGVIKVLLWLKKQQNLF